MQVDTGVYTRGDASSQGCSDPLSIELPVGIAAPRVRNVPFVPLDIFSAKRTDPALTVSSRCLSWGLRRPLDCIGMFVEVGSWDRALRPRVHAYTLRQALASFLSGTIPSAAPCPDRRIRLPDPANEFVESVDVAEKKKASPAGGKNLHISWIERRDSEFLHVRARDPHGSEQGSKIQDLVLAAPDAAGHGEQEDPIPQEGQEPCTEESQNEPVPGADCHRNENRQKQGADSRKQQQKGEPVKPSSPGDPEKTPGQNRLIRKGRRRVLHGVRASRILPRLSGLLVRQRFRFSHGRSSRPAHKPSRRRKKGTRAYPARSAC